MKSKWRSLFRLALPFIVTVFLPILSVLSLGNTMLNDYHDHIVSVKQREIETAFERFLHRIGNVETLAYTISQSNATQNYIYSSIGDREHTLEEKKGVSELLQNFMVNKDVKAVYYYDVKDNRIITPDAALSNAEDYFRYTYRIGNLTPEESIERLLDFTYNIEYSTDMDVSFHNQDKKVIEYKMLLPLGTVGGVQGILTFVLETDKLFYDFYALLEDGCELYIYDNNNRLTSSIGDSYSEIEEMNTTGELIPISFRGKVIHGMTCQSSNKSWTVKIYIPNLVEEGIGQDLLPRFWLLVFAPIFISVMFCVYFTYINHREISSVLRIMTPHDEVVREEERELGYRSIREYANKLISENSYFKERVKDYTYTYKCSVLDKLIRNVYDSQEKEKVLNGLELVVKDEQCVALCIWYDDNCYRDRITDDLTVKDFLKVQFGALLDRQYEMFDASARETVCILAIEDKENAEMILRELISRLNVEVSYYYNIELQLVAGNVVDSIRNISESYQQAKAVLKYNESSEKKLCLYSELVQLKDMYYYPKESDEKIYNYIIAGKVAEAKSILGQICQINFVDNEGIMSAAAMENVKKKLINCMNYVAEKYEISIIEQVRLLEQEKDAKQYFDIISKMTEIIWKEINCKKRTVQSHVASRIMNYVEENYCDNTLSLKQISMTFGITETYVSNLFKTSYGENLSVVIEKLRIERACELIKDTNMKIGEIANTVGYTSDVSFRRAFKKIIGVSPGEYREM